MTRRDTIIAAVLVNAGLLIVLFASALKSDGSEPTYSSNPNDRIEPASSPVLQQEVAISQGDEVDQVLKQYANPTPAIAAAQAPLVQPAETPAQSNFADDLRAITLPEAAAQPVSSPIVQAPIAQAPFQQDPASTSLSVIDYKVKKGDVLEKIARHHHCSVSDIMKLNHLSSANLRIGQTLKIPAKSASASSIAKTNPVESVSTPADTSVKYYTVKNGDNPWTIAVKNHMKVEDLLKLNNLDQEKARKLKPGDKLRIN